MKSVAGTSRAKMYIRRDLSWCEGFPLSTKTWLAAPRNEEAFARAIDRDLIRRRVA